MPDVTVKTIDELDSYANQFFYAGKALGVTSFGMNLLRLPAGWQDYPDHDHAEKGEEEVYVVLEGAATLTAGEKTVDVERGTLVRVGAEQKRKFVPGPDGVTLLALGGTPGKAYELRS